VPQRSTLVLLLFLIYINDIKIGIKSSILNFADDAKMLGKVDALRKDLKALCDWFDKW